MRKAFLISGRVKNRTTIVLDEPLGEADIGSEVEVVLREPQRGASMDETESLVVVMDRGRMDAALSGVPMDIEVLDARPGGEDEPTESPVVVARRKPGSSRPPPGRHS